MNSILKTSRYTSLTDVYNDSSEDDESCMMRFLSCLFPCFYYSEKKYSYGHRHGPTSEESFVDRLDRLDRLDSISKDSQRLLV
jgi:hypothetical protein